MAGKNLGCFPEKNNFKISLCRVLFSSSSFPINFGQELLKKNIKKMPFPGEKIPFPGWAAKLVPHRYQAIAQKILELEPIRTNRYPKKGVI